MKAPDILRAEIKKTAEDNGLFDRKIPSRTYCAITIQAMAKLLDMSVTDLVMKIEAQHSSS